METPPKPDPRKLELQQQDPTEVYPGQTGYVIIRQVSGLGEESVIYIRPDDIDRLVGMLKLTEPKARASLAEYRDLQEGQA